LFNSLSELVWICYDPITFFYQFLTYYHYTYAFKKKGGQMKSKKKIVLISSAALVLSFIIGVFAYNSYQDRQRDFLAQENSEVFVRDYSPTMGAEKPKVFLVEFLDPECESCRRFAPFVKELISKYKDEVQLVIRYAPFHGNSEFAASVLEASREQGKYWEVLDLLFRYQPQWGSHHNPRPELIWGYLPEVGVNVGKLRVDMRDPKIAKRIQQDVKDGKTLGVKATPTFFINGKVLERFGKEPLEAAIKRALESQ
jgi:protein-disulfide isomerase